MFGFELGHLKGTVLVRAAETDLSPLVLCLDLSSAGSLPSPHHTLPLPTLSFPYFLCRKISGCLEPSLPSCFTHPFSDSRAALQRQPCPTCPPAWTALPPLTHFLTPGTPSFCEFPLLNSLLGGVPATCLLPRVLPWDAADMPSGLCHRRGGGPVPPQCTAAGASAPIYAQSAPKRM